MWMHLIDFIPEEHLRSDAHLIMNKRLKISSERVRVHKYEEYKNTNKKFTQDVPREVRKIRSHHSYMKVKEK
jgi:hypothetical protein